jgi:hypothetical protein
MKPFLSDRPRIDAPAVKADPASAPAAFIPAAARPALKKHAESDATRIECVREGDRVTRIIVVCACGERIEIDCLYAAGR